MEFLLKLVGGWLPIGTKPFPEWLGKVLWAVGIYAACTLALGIIFPAKPPVQNIGVYQQAPARDMMGVGCNFFRGYARTGISAK